MSLSFHMVASSIVLRFVSCVGCLTSFTACESVLGLDEFSVVQQTDDDHVSGTSCTSHLDCGSGDSPYRCAHALKRCARLSTADCTVLAGPDRDDRALWLGLLTSTSGPQMRANAARQASAVLAVDSINASGGVPFAATAQDVHPVVLIGCDAGRDMLRAAGHLVTQLGVRAIIGPDESQDGVLLTTKVAIPNDALVVGPTATETRLADLLDDSLQWSMVPNDGLRAPWMRQQLHALEAALRDQRGSELKLAIAVRDDTQGQSARESLSTLTFGGRSLTDAANLGNRVRIDAYSPDGPNQTALVDAYLEFAPDIVMVFGMTEAVTQIMAPLEERWAAKRARTPAPEYVLTDAAKVPELLQLLARSGELRERVRGIGATNTLAAREVHAAIRAAYEQRYDRELAGVSGLDSTFDAVHAIAFAAASARQFPLTGRSLATGLRTLSMGHLLVDVRADKLESSLERMAAGTSLRVMGSLAPLGWDDRGAPSAGALEVWCVSAQAGRVEFSSSGFRADVPNEPPQLSGRGCRVTQAEPEPDQTAVGVPMSVEPMPSRSPDTAPSQPEAPQTVDAGAPPAAADAGMPAAAAPSASTASIPCGATACDPSRDFCCVSTLRGLTEDPQPEDFSCARDRNDCAVSLHCTSDSDCTEGNVCCGITNTTRCVPEAMCASQAGTRLQCESSRSCATGLSCCAHLSPGVATYASILCEAECGPLGQGLQLCETDADCTNALVTLTCAPSRVIPNLKLCGLR
jgi:ABC-type branched-subunit amino acid transport system substrate-binding protein